MTDITAPTLVPAQSVIDSVLGVPLMETVLALILVGAGVLGYVHSAKNSGDVALNGSLIVCGLALVAATFIGGVVGIALAAVGFIAALGAIVAYLSGVPTTSDESERERSRA